MTDWEIEWERLRPARGLLLVRRAPPRKVTEGGIVLPQTADTRRAFAEVLRVGAPLLSKAAAEIPPGVKEGEVIVMHPHAHDENWVGRGDPGEGSEGEGLRVHIIEFSAALAVVDGDDIPSCMQDAFWRAWGRAEA